MKKQNTTLTHQLSPSRPVNLHCPEPSRTKLSCMQECDMNYILKGYQKTGLITHVNNHQGNYLDLQLTPDYHTALNQINEANEAFSTLPSSIRKRFNNNPHEFLSFVSNPDNETEMQDLGLLPKPVPTPAAEPAPAAEPLTE